MQTPHLLKLLHSKILPAYIIYYLIGKKLQTFEWSNYLSVIVFSCPYNIAAYYYFSFFFILGCRKTHAHTHTHWTRRLWVFSHVMPPETSELT